MESSKVITLAVATVNFRLPTVTDHESSNSLQPHFEGSAVGCWFRGAELETRHIFAWTFSDVESVLAEAAGLELPLARFDDRGLSVF